MNTILLFLSIQRFVSIVGYPVHGAWTIWADPKHVGRCTVTCGKKLGTVSIAVTRTCTNPKPSNGGKMCQGDPEKVTTTKCISTTHCPVDGGWTNWYIQSKGQCSVTCGKGIEFVIMSRNCNNPPPKYKGMPCIGGANTTTKDVCDTQVDCGSDVTPHPPVNGGWSGWMPAPSSNSECSVTCGKGNLMQFVERRCNNPMPEHGGLYCVGNLVQTKMIDCDTHIMCSVDGRWSAWKTTYGECSVTCGRGTKKQTRTRRCNNPPPQYGGSCFGDPDETKDLVCDMGINCLGDNTLDTPSKQVSGSNTGAIVGAIVAILVLIGVAIGGVLYYRKKTSQVPPMQQAKCVHKKRGSHPHEHHNEHHTEVPTP